MWNWLKYLVGAKKTNKRTKATRLGVESLETREVPAVTVASLLPYGLSPGLSSALVRSYQQAQTLPSILSPRPVAPAVQQQAQARLNAGSNNLNYLLNPAGYNADLLTAYGYGSLNNLTITGGAASAIYNDPWIASQSGQLAYNTTLNYITNHLSTGATSLNGVGVLNSVGLGNTALATAIGQAQAIGALGNSRPAGTGSGSPFIDSFGPPIGSRPQDRITYPGYATVSPFVSSFGAPVGYRPQDGSPLIYVHPAQPAPAQTTSAFAWNGNPYQWGANNPYAYHPIG